MYRLPERSWSLIRIFKAFYKFEQHAPGTGRMNEHIAVSAGADFDFVADKTCAGGFQAFDRSGKVGNVQGNVVKPLSALLQEFRNRGIRDRRFEQLDAALAYGHHGNTNLLRLDGFLGHDFQPEFLVKLLSFGERLHGYAEMIDLRHWCFPSSPTISSTSEYGSRLCSATSAANRSASPFPR